MASQPTPDRKCHRPRRLNAHLASALPFVLIGHSKLFSRVNEWALRPFLNLSARQDRCCFDTPGYQRGRLPMTQPAAARPPVRSGDARPQRGGVHRDEAAFGDRADSATQRRGALPQPRRRARRCAGAVQLFRRACFQQIGGDPALPAAASTRRLKLPHECRTGRRGPSPTLGCSSTGEPALPDSGRSLRASRNHAASFTGL